jgi:hypothetical protein
MEKTKLKTPKKGAVKRMRELYEKNRGKASAELIEILKTPSTEKSRDKTSAMQKNYAEI